MAPISMNTPMELTYIDVSKELTRIKLYGPPLEDDGSNFGDVFDPTTGSLDDLRGAIALVTTLNEVKGSVSLIGYTNTPTPPTDVQAQREFGARMSYADSVNGRIGTFFIPGLADAYLPTGTDDINMGDALWIAFKAVFDANAYTRDGNPAVLVGGHVTGRHR